MHPYFTVYEKASDIAGHLNVIFTVLISFTWTERLGTSASSLPVVDLVSIPYGLFVCHAYVVDTIWSRPCETWGTLHIFPDCLFIYSSILFLTVSVLKNCNISTSIGAHFPCVLDCFVDASARLSPYLLPDTIDIFHQCIFYISWCDDQTDHDQLWYGK